MSHFLSALEVEERLIGPARRAAAFHANRPEGGSRRFWNAVGEVTREEFHEFIDSYMCSEYEGLARSAVLGAQTPFPRFAEKIRHDLAGMLVDDPVSDGPSRTDEPDDEPDDDLDDDPGRASARQRPTARDERESDLGRAADQVPYIENDFVPPGYRG